MENDRFLWQCFPTGCDQRVRKQPKPYRVGLKGRQKLVGLGVNIGILRK